MAIIYSYPQVVQPALSDLLVGTDVSTKNKVTKSFSIQSIVDLVETAVPGGGTVTSIDTNSSTFITLSGGPISTAGTITASLSATGVPTSTKFLRGDNTWATPPGGTDTTYTISSAQNGSAANIRLTGSDGGQNIVTLIAGANITLTDNGSNAITIASTANGGGGACCSVNAGNGLKIESGTPASNPVIGVDYVGSNNFILKGQSQTTITEQDYIPFNDISSGSVKTTTMGVIPPSALSLVKQYIDAGDADDITNSTDSFTTTAKVQKVVSLTSSEYASITPDANTLYLIVGALPTFTVTLAFTNTISGTAYTIGGNQAGATREGISGSSYAFNTTISPNPGFFFSSGPTVTNATGTITTNETVYTLLSGTVEAIPTPQCTATLFVNTSGVTGTQFTLGGNLTGAIDTGDCPNDYSFNTTITANPGYEFTSGPVITNASGQISGDQTVQTTITGVIEAVTPPPVAVTASINLSNLTGVSGQVSGSVTPGSYSGNSPLAYSFTPSVTANAGYSIENLTFTGDLSGTATQSKTAVIYANGNVVADPVPAVVQLSIDDRITGGLEGVAYDLSGNLDGATQSGSVPFGYAFNTYVTVRPNWEFTSGPTVQNASGTTSQEGSQTVTTVITGNVQEIVTPVTATLNVIEDITGPPNVYSITGNQDGATQSGAPDFTYSFTTGVSIPSGYEWTDGPYITPTQPNVGTISTNTTVNTTIRGTIAAVIVEGTVNLAFSNNVNGSENTTTALGASTSITGAVSDNYTFINSISANSGYEFTVGPSWDPTAVITGIIASGTTNLTQSVTGTVTAIAVPQYYALQKCSTGGSGFTTNLNTDQLTLSTGDIVVDTAPNPDEYYTVLAGRPTVQGSTFVILTGLQSCPTPLYYYNVVQCSGAGTDKVSSEVPNLTTDYSYTYNSVCYSIVDTDVTQNPSYDITGLPTGCCDETLNSFITTSIAQSTGADACSQPKTQNRSHDGSGALPTTGDTVYLGATIGSGNVGAGFWGLTNDTYYQTNSSGLVTSVQACPVVNGTVNLTVTNQVFNSSYTVNPASQTITGQVGDPYTFTTTVVPYSGYELVPGTIEYNGLPNGIQSGTISAGTTEITQTITGQTRLLEYYTLTKCDPNGGPGFVSFVDIYDSINGTVANPPLSNGDTVYDAGNDYYYTVTGTTPTQGSTGLSSYTGGTGCPAPLYYYNVVQCSGTGIDKVSSEVANLTSDYSYTYNSVCYKIVDTDPTQTPSYDITSLPSGCCTATVNVNFTNSVVGKANTTTIIADGGTASATGPVGTSYSITNSISANGGYEFTSGPTWSTGGTGTVTGTFTSGTTNIAQSVSGVVEQEVAECNCITVDVLNTQLTNNGLDLYYIFNSCSAGETSVNLAQYPGIEQNGSTYFALCETGAGGNLYKYGPNGSPFVGLSGMNTNPNLTSCVDNFECTAVVP